MKFKPPIDWRQLDLDDDEQAEAFDLYVEEAAKAAGEEAEKATAAARRRAQASLPAK
jgi:hypothetical protein